MKVIDVLNKIANGEIKAKTNFKIVWKSGLARNIYYDENEGCFMNSLKNISDGCSIYDDVSLNDEVEILEDKKEEIEEIQADDNYCIHTELGSFKGRKMDIAFVNKFNELTKIVNKLNKQDTSKETNCMTD